MPSYRRRPSKGDHRMFFCALCGALVFLCRVCDRRHRFCSTECAAAKYRRNRNALARWRSKTDKGRSQNAERPRRWRERQRQRARRENQSAAPQPVTYHQASATASTAKISRHTSKSPRPPHAPPATARFEPLNRREGRYQSASVANTSAPELPVERCGLARVDGGPDRRNQADLRRRLRCLIA